MKNLLPRLGLYSVCLGFTLAGPGPVHAAETGPALALHPDNPKIFLWRGAPTLLLGSGEHYGAVLNLDFDFVPYLDELRACGLNHTRTFSGMYREAPGSFGITDNPLAPPAARYCAPWPRSSEPGARDGLNRFDLSRWNPAYFERLHRFMAAARDRGVVVELVLFCPMYQDEMWHLSPLFAGNNINSVGDCPREEAFSLKHDGLTRVQTALTRKLAEELRGYDNLYYEICNEPYFGGVTDAWQRRITDTLVETEAAFPQPHLLSWNIANGSRKVDRPHPAVSIYNFHYCFPPDAVARNAHLPRVIGENETGFRGRPDVLYRSEAWDFMLAGGGLFSHLDYSFTPTHPDGRRTEYRSPGGGSPALRRQFGDGIDRVRAAPDATSVRPLQAPLTGRALSIPGADYALYLRRPVPGKADGPLPEPDPTPAPVDLDLPAGRYTATWLHPATGTQQAGGQIEHPGGTWHGVTPPFGFDLALRLRRVPER